MAVKDEKKQTGAVPKEDLLALTENIRVHVRSIYQADVPYKVTVHGPGKTFKVNVPSLKEQVRKRAKEIAEEHGLSDMVEDSDLKVEVSSDMTRTDFKWMIGIVVTVGLAMLSLTGYTFSHNSGQIDTLRLAVTEADKSLLSTLQAEHGVMNADMKALRGNDTDLIEDIHELDKKIDILILRNERAAVPLRNDRAALPLADRATIPVAAFEDIPMYDGAVEAVAGDEPPERD